MTRIAIVGSRTFKRLELVAKFVRSLPYDTVIVSGGAKGVDSTAENIAKHLGMKTDIYLPDYARYGKSAPMIRNSLIIENCDEVVAFWDGVSKGTKDSIDKAERLGKPCKIYLPK